MSEPSQQNKEETQKSGSGSFGEYSSDFNMKPTLIKRTSNSKNLKIINFGTTEKFTPTFFKKIKNYYYCYYKMYHFIIQCMSYVKFTILGLDQ